ncbi:hypothetical protein N0V90_010160 [Kalmusia sp. IMI 367209]|nr:hypothetical protein N0V90_010160 [Kalmusia sp. IMI 367209]
MATSTSTSAEKEDTSSGSRQASYQQVASFNELKPLSSSSSEATAGPLDQHKATRDPTTITAMRKTAIDLSWEDVISLFDKIYDSSTTTLLVLNTDENQKALTEAQNAFFKRMFEDP